MVTVVVDNLSSPERSALMSRVRGKNTKPELVVRKLLHSMGYRFRLHGRDLPGTPDIVLPKRRTIIFVHGCYWHGHNCSAGRLPKTRVDFWSRKITANRARDVRAVRALRRQGWSTLIIWQCQIRDLKRLTARLQRHLKRQTSASDPEVQASLRCA